MDCLFAINTNFSNVEHSIFQLILNFNFNFNFNLA